MEVQVINETVRLANIVPGIFRKTLRETKFKGVVCVFVSLLYSYMDCSETWLFVMNGVGYTIPAGWAVMVCPPAVHLDPSKYKDPLDFNPWRWEASTHTQRVCSVTLLYHVQIVLIPNVQGVDTNGASKNFMAFGGGMRFCVGTDFTKVQMAVFLHCLVTKYK